MALPSGHIVLGAEEMQAAEEHYMVLEAKLQAIRQQNEELTHALQEQQEIAVIERIKGGRWLTAQTQEFANLTSKLLVGQRGPEV